MRVVYSPAHLAHDTVTETVSAAWIPANEVAERAERIRATLEADGGFTIEAPTEHGTDPILAVHDEGLLRFLEEAWPAARAQSIGRPFLIADTVPELPHVRGHEPGVPGVAAGDGLRRRPGRLVGPRHRQSDRAGPYGRPGPPSTSR